MLPDVSEVTNKLVDRMEAIKKNNFILPSIDEIKKLEGPIEEKEVPKAITFHVQEIHEVPPAIVFEPE